MRVVKISPLKRLVTVVPESTLDLLNVYRVLEPGDVVYAVTSRELKKERRDGSVDSVRVVVELGVEVAEKSLDPMLKRLDLLGVIRYESRELGLVGKHHSIHVSVGDELTVESRKNFPRLEAMARYYREPGVKKGVALVLVDDESLGVYRAEPSGMRVIFHEAVVEGKREPEQRQKALQKIYAAAAEKLGDAGDVYVFGPSITVDEFITYLKREKPNLYQRVKKTGFVSTTDHAGVSELMRGGMLRELGEEVKAVADVLDVEELMRVLATEPGKASLGFVETLNALRMGAVEKVLVSEDFLWSKHMDKNVWELIDGAEAFGASVRVISTGSEAADKLNGLGGVAAFLRYPVDPTVLRRVD
ncbi:MAG: hypothetical protein QXE96_05055 [Candidatus Caldarchaeum sp.]